MKINLKRSSFIFLIFVSIIFILFPYTNVAADFGGFISGITTAAVRTIVAILLLALFYISLGFLKLGVFLFSYATIPLFNLPFTIPGQAPAGNPIILVGWRIIRDIVNMGFILGLLYIGLATALRLSNFKMQKSFALLILIALVINFSPVICGIVVDASNLVMAFFLGGATDWSKLESVMTEDAAQNVSNAIEANFTAPAFFNMLCLIIFGLVGGFIFLLYAALYLVRNIALWIIVIFSPAAFFSYIFNQTRKYFFAWWQQLIEWAFIGAITAFFIYLAAYSLMLIQNGNITINPMSLEEGIQNPATKAPYFFVALIFLIIGYKVSKKTNAAGAQAIMGLTTAALTTVGLATVGGVGAALKKGFSYAGKNFLKQGREEETSEFIQKHKWRAALKFGVFGEGLSGLAQLTPEQKEQLGGAKLLTYLTRGAVSATTVGMPIWGSSWIRNFSEKSYLEYKKRDEEKVKEYKEKDLSGLKVNVENAKAKGLLIGRESFRIAKAIIEKGELNKAMGQKIISKENLEEAMQYASKQNYYDDYNKLTRAYRGETGKEGEEKLQNQIEKDSIRKNVQELKAMGINEDRDFRKTLEKIDKDLLTKAKYANVISEKFAEELLKNNDTYKLLTSEVISALVKEHGEKIFDIINETLQKMDDAVIENLIDKNAKLMTYLVSTTAHSISPIKYKGKMLTKEKIREVLKLKKPRIFPSGAQK